MLSRVFFCFDWHTSTHTHFDLPCVKSRTMAMWRCGDVAMWRCGDTQNAHFSFDSIVCVARACACMHVAHFTLWPSSCCVARLSRVATIRIVNLVICTRRRRRRQPVHSIIFARCTHNLWRFRVDEKPIVPIRSRILILYMRFYISPSMRNGTGCLWTPFLIESHTHTPSTSDKLDIKIVRTIYSIVFD